MANKKNKNQKPLLNPERRMKIIIADYSGEMPEVSFSLRYSFRFGTKFLEDLFALLRKYK